MKIGTLLSLEIKDREKGEIVRFRCKVAEKNEHYLFIDHPIEVKTNKSVFLPEGTHLIASYVGKDQSVYQFHTKIAAQIKMNVPVLAIHIPNKDKIKRIQRREYVRVETAVDVAIHSVELSFTTVTSDISGGGMAIIIPSNKLIEAEDEMDICLVLPLDSGDYQYVNALAEVVRVKEDKSSARIASMKFTKISKYARQGIIRYCFERQREARNKELL
ncbi:flagellar brake protein [Virgibacillus kekensis]|uniref:Flagellar brake protein n=1 Tax=Virgibacillus kekensis TaxID=202261 RepID=A0ABV9DF22_9BACI